MGPGCAGRIASSGHRSTPRRGCGLDRNGRPLWVASRRGRRPYARRVAGVAGPGVREYWRGCVETGKKGHPMIRLTVIAVMLAIGAASLATPQANAQSPDPALLAPGQSGRLMAPPRYSEPRPSYASARHHRDRYRNWHGARLSHPSIHNH